MRWPHLSGAGGLHPLSLAVRANLLAAGADDNVNVTLVILDALLCAALDSLSLLLHLRDLRGLALHLTGASQRAVHLACTGKHIFIEQRLLQASTAKRLVDVQLLEGFHIERTAATQTKN